MNTEKTSNNRKSLIIILLLLVIAFLLFVQRKEYNKRNLEGDKNLSEDGTEKIEDFVPIVDDDAQVIIPSDLTEEERKEYVQKLVEESVIWIDMNYYPCFKNGKAEGNVNFKHQDAKSADYLLYAKITLDDEILYESKGIPYGSSIPTVKLSKELPKGKYDCIASFYKIHKDTGIKFGPVKSKMVLTIEN